VLEDHRNDPIVRELVQFIHAMSQDEQIDLVALAWLGRDDGDIENWQALRAEAARAHNDRTASYLLGLPLLSDFLEDGLSKLGGSCTEFHRRAPVAVLQRRTTGGTNKPIRRSS
jgi:hypothetical protein